MEMGKARGYVWLSLLPYIIGAIAFVGVVWYGWHKANRWCNEICSEQKDIADAAILRVGTLETAIAEAQQRATDLALLWSEAINRETVKYVEVVKWQTRVFTKYRERAPNVAVSGRITLAPDARVLLGDVARSASEAAGSPAAPAGDSKPDAPVPDAPGGDVDTTAQEWVVWSVAVSEWAAEANAKHRACVEAYGRIREASTSQ